MTIDEFKEKRIEIYDKCNAEIDIVIEKKKLEGTWIGGLTSDPPEIQAIKDKAFSEIRELAKMLEN